MGLMDKFKNLFTEEVEVEVEEQPVKATKTQVEIASPTPKRSEKHHDIAPLEEPDIVEDAKPKEEEYKFPFFDDNDFETIEHKEEKEKKKSSYRKEVYNPPKPEKKVFKPTPIISPVYGILDKNYQKEDIVPKNGANNYSNPKEDMIDAFRNKAYGTLEDDIETTLFGNNRVLFDDTEEKVEKLNDEVETKKIDEEYSHVLISDPPRHGIVEEEDLTDLLEEEMSKDEVKEEKPKPISDEELFNMIDSFYEKGDKKEWLVF